MIVDPVFILAELKYREFVPQVIFTSFPTPVVPLDFIVNGTDVVVPALITQQAVNT